MKVTPTDLPGVLVLEPKIFRDERGFFIESYNRRTFGEHGLDLDFVQDNHARSRRGVLRGLHYQVQQPQGKLLRVISGRVFDVAVDMRRSSSHFGKWTSVILDGEQQNMFWVPPGFAHGYLVLSETADLVYKTTDFYAPQHDRTLLWNDPQVGIQWPDCGAEIVLSEKDRGGKRLADAEVYP